MNRINYEQMKEYINDTNKIAFGKEVNVYRNNDVVLKLFHELRKSPFKLMPLEGMIKLSELPLKHFNKPIDLIINKDEIVGYTEKMLVDSDNENIDYEGIKQDIKILSDNGFGIEDLYYNYIYTDQGLTFFDLTSYSYINTEVEFLKKRLYQKNIDTMNTFMIGLIDFDCFKKGEHNEYTKIYLANQYRVDNCGSKYYGDFIKEKENSGYKH